MEKLVEKKDRMIDYYDIGLNLFCRQFKDPDKIIKEAEENNVCCILTGADMKDDEKVNKYLLNRGKADYPVYGTAGIHPHNADGASEKDFKRIREIIKTNSKVVAVGEAGLDYNRMFSEKNNQLNCLKKQIEIAEELGYPMFLHERDAAEDFIKIFKEHRSVAERSVVHCYTGNKKELEELLELGFSIGITGWILDNRRADDLRDAVEILPLSRVLIETDAPYLIPRGIKGLGSVNVPQNIVYVARALAGYMKVDEEELKKVARDNTERVFKLCTSH
jgi:TatD DNase family protein